MTDRIAATSTSAAGPSHGNVRQPDRAARFGQALYAALRPPLIDNADANGDGEDAESSRPTLTAAVSLPLRPPPIR